MAFKVLSDPLPFESLPRACFSLRCSCSLRRSDLTDSGYCGPCEASVEFSNCTSDGAGGALELQFWGVTITGSTMTGNSAVFSGGAISMLKSYATGARRVAEALFIVHPWNHPRTIRMIISHTLPRQCKTSNADSRILVEACLFADNRRASPCRARAFEADGPSPRALAFPERDCSTAPSYPPHPLPPSQCRNQRGRGAI